MRAGAQSSLDARTAAIIAAGLREFSIHPYAEANTDRITADCGISKGLLYHYFGTKKNFYLACVRRALDTLTQGEAPIPQGDFYAVLFASMERKLRQCTEHPMETKLLNMASRELSREVRAEAEALIGRYAPQIRSHSERVVRAAVATLRVKPTCEPLAVQGLTLYVNALVNRYLVLYQEQPEAFFARQQSIRAELRDSIDLMLYGICEEPLR